MSDPGAMILLPRPEHGRVVERQRRVRLGDVDGAGRCRLDALARYLQDVARDDSAEVDTDHTMWWIVRRTMMEIERSPVLEERLELATWCSGFGGRWAERRTEIRGDHGAMVETSTLWVHVDRESGRPARLPELFHEIWGEAAAGRRVSARSSLATDPPDDATDRPWVVRSTDLDILDHMNNAAHWEPVEEALAQRGAPWRARAELEHGTAVSMHQDVRLHVRTNGDLVETWLVTDGVTASVARVSPRSA